jgi:tRNA/rRNA methyltransferase
MGPTDRNDPSPDSIGAAGAVPAAQLRFVLVEPSHCGNIGASARAVRTMGFERLFVVLPRDPGFRTAPEAVALAAAAGEVLQAARACDSLAQALEGVQLAFATTGYARELAPAPVSVRAAAVQAARALDAPGAQVAFVFGPERTGLSNADVQRCHGCCFIPTDPVLGSLNLAQAVQVVAYEARLAMLAHRGQDVVPAPRRDHSQVAARGAEAPAGVEQTEALFEHLARGLEAIGYLDPDEPKYLMARLRRLLLRARPSTVEVEILRGIAAAMILPRKLRAGRKTPR